MGWLMESNRVQRAVMVLLMDSARVTHYILSGGDWASGGWPLFSGLQIWLGQSQVVNRGGVEPKVDRRVPHVTSCQINDG